MWSKERFLELAKAEEEALDGTCGILACSPSFYREFKAILDRMDQITKSVMEERAGVQVEVPAHIRLQVEQR